MKRHGIAYRLATLILSCAFVILAAILGYNYAYSRAIILRQSETNSRHLAQETASRIDSVLLSVQKVANNIAYALEDTSLSKDDVLKLNKRVIANNPEIYGMAIAFEPYAQEPEKLYFAPYHFRSGGRIAFTMLGNPDYRYFYMDWYQIPKELEQPIWTEPYNDQGGGGVVMATYAVPFFRHENGKKVFAGVVTADISLEWLQDMLDDIHIFDTGYAFLLSRQGTFIAHPNRKLIMNQTIFSLAEEMEAPAFRQIGREMTAGGNAFVQIDESVFGTERYLFHAGLEYGGWSLGILFPKSEMLADVHRLSNVMTLIGLAGFVLLALVITAIARRITKPLTELSESALQIASGNLDLMLPEVDSNDEVGDLASSFKIMKTSLKEYIANLTNTTAAKERIESELRIAREIQMGILPKLFPAFPDRTEFEVFASIEPAKEVGGDLYDFFFVDDTHFCFLVGDVSGKGVPAAFFMAVTKTLLKVVAEKGLDPGQILSKVNADLASENESCMFVTLFLAIIDIETGETRYANAGHNPPILLPCGGEPQWVPPFGEPVAGIMDGMEYSTKTMTMEPGDILFIYTDGVTEAMDPEQTLYSEDRLMRTVAEIPDRLAPALVKTVNDSVLRFARGAEQSDDITMLAMQYCGKCKK
ncbi:MAG: SpoIIE family protein phosphatase [Pseudodesulfovibrio sp.]|uniref:Stage II sporulation protein E n=1 Tax=Pseudodesulfovibrio aespoeensis (strain ATCC 700646 / DSM 10631 / Aspo-2) TaxID=643562 RepID=E6VYT3_PSEA9|nr:MULTISPECIES: SpoIIE family protein phosphatase [Pseudodesulfovibrio]MBU4379278.1 SpoIIE family protein phosphatase [Pseudomonadota bacterium]ADU63950.1 Stage II sporulation protein E [Pseudodesulfovibrio aespoeensis Aspo-2]MBU4474380.1 SpoIIE family protein phosphatase [Pseudomonadota bacterium]MBU4517025.1 SpoIIE family protein phosphatase [Pseudomonadota bacterium]MBU4523276.1 SpoIIE family protein phosphatase [Pseudomonadota bacterium]